MEINLVLTVIVMMLLLSAGYTKANSCGWYAATTANEAAAVAEVEAKKAMSDRLYERANRTWAEWQAMEKYKGMSLTYFRIVNPIIGFNTSAVRKIIFETGIAAYTDTWQQVYDQTIISCQNQ